MGLFDMEAMPAVLPPMLKPPVPTTFRIKSPPLLPRSSREPPVPELLSSDAALPVRTRMPPEATAMGEPPELILKPDGFTEYRMELTPATDEFAPVVVTSIS